MRFFCCFLLISFLISLCPLCFCSEGYTFIRADDVFVFPGVLPAGQYYIEGKHEGFSGRSEAFYFDGDSLVAEIAVDTFVNESFYETLLLPFGLAVLSGESVLYASYLSTFDSLTVLPLVPSVDSYGLMQSVQGLLSGNFNAQNLLIVISAALGLSVGLVLLWFGFVYIKGKLISALRKGSF